MVCPPQRAGVAVLLECVSVCHMPSPHLTSARLLQVINGTLQLLARHENITDPNLIKQGYANFTTAAVKSVADVRCV